MSEENDAPKGDEFKAITSQEELNKIIGGRIDAVKKQFADYEDLKSKADRLGEIEEANKSDLEKATARAEAAEAKVQQFEQRQQVAQWKSEIVKDSAVPAELLNGSTREELEEQFERLKPHFTKAPPRRTAAPAGTSPAGGGGSRAVQALRELRGTA